MRNNCKQWGWVPTMCLAFAWVTTACNDLFEAHPYSGKIDGEKGLTLRNVTEIEDAMAHRTSFKFAFISDTQRAYDATRDVVKAINARGDIDFVIHGGDLTDFGLTSEYEWMRNLLNGLKMPWVTVIGNHDCIGNGEHVYKKMFGDVNYAFTAGSTRFVCMNTNALEYDYSDPVPDFNFMEEQALLCMDSIAHTVIVMHAPPYAEQFNNNVAKVFDYYTTRFPGMDKAAPCYDEGQGKLSGAKRFGFCINGHNHSHTVKDTFGNGIVYYQVANIAKREYMVFTITEEGYEYENIEF